MKNKILLIELMLLLCSTLVGCDDSIALSDSDKLYRQVRSEIESTQAYFEFAIVGNDMDKVAIEFGSRPAVTRNGNAVFTVVNRNSIRYARPIDCTVIDEKYCASKDMLYEKYAYQYDKIIESSYADTKYFLLIDSTRYRGKDSGLCFMHLIDNVWLKLKFEEENEVVEMWSILKECSIRLIRSHVDEGEE